MTYRIRSTFFAVVGAVCAPVLSYAATLYSDDFNADTSAAWTTNVAPAANASLQQAQFAWDYSAFGIPAAPGSADTLGLRLRANIPGGAAAPVNTRPGGVLSGLSLSPTGQSFGANYRMTVYAWANFFGAANVNGLADNNGSQGGTFNVLAAVGTSGTAPVVVGFTDAADVTTQVSGSNIDGIAFATSNDGGIPQDYRVFPKSQTPVTAGAVLAAGAAANSNSYYTSLFPPVAAPAVQQAMALAEYDAPGTGDNTNNVMAGMTQAGAFGFKWHKVEITKLDGTVTWRVDDTLLATVTGADALGLGGENIALGTSDVNTSTARYPSLAFTLFDNLVVESVVPEPATGTMAIAGMAMAGLLARRKR